MSHIIFDACVRGLTPIPMVSVDVWADNTRVLPSKSSAEPGRWSTDRTPYLREVMWEMSPQSKTEEIVVIKGTQLGFTEVGVNSILCYMDLYPCPILMIMPTEPLARRFSMTKLTPSIQSIKNLNKKVKAAKTKNDGGGAFEKDFVGGMFSLGWSFSDSSTASFSAKVLILDDIDRFSVENSGEGDFIKTAKNRTDAMPGSKIYINSSPKSKATSRITPEFIGSDQRHYYVPCPHCTPRDIEKQNKKNMFLFENENFKYQRDDEGDLLGDAYMICPHCKEKILEKEKTWMMSLDAGAKWIPHKEGRTKRGYRLPSFYSPIGWVSWNKLAMEHIEAHMELKEGNNRLLKTFHNTRLAKAWEDTIDAKEASELDGLKSIYKPWEIPMGGVAFLSMAVDVQLDHFWVDVFVHQYGATSHSIRHQRVETWASVEEVMRMPYRDTKGGIYMVRSCAVDSGYKRDEVYEFCGMNSDIAFPIKGGSTGMANPWKVTSLDNGLKLYVIDTEYFKDMFWAKIERTVDAVSEGKLSDGMFFCHSESDDAYFGQLASEHKKETIDKKGRKKYGWETRRSKIDNHLFDTGCYNTFIGELAGIRFLSPITETQNVRKRKRSDDEFDYASKF